MNDHPLHPWLLYSLSNLAYQTSITDILERYKSLENFLSDKIKTADLRHLIKTKQNLIETTYRWAELPKQHIIPYCHPGYPPRLKTIAHPPALIYVKGDPSTLSLKQIAIVGSRHPTHSGLFITAQFSKALIDVGFCITSGMAQGIDVASHEAALTSSGKTIAVLGNGLHSIYPKKHTAIANAITEQGCVISEFPLNTPPIQKNFPQRNRIISGLSLGTLVVEAKKRSGSLITARYAVEQGREVFAVPGSIRHALSQGCHQLLRDGATLAESVNDILNALDIPTISLTYQDNISKYHNTTTELDPRQQQLLACVDYEGTTIDEVIDRSEFSASTVARLLLKLELHGYISSTQRGYARVK